MGEALWQTLWQRGRACGRPSGSVGGPVADPLEAWGAPWQTLWLRGGPAAGRLGGCPSLSELTRRARAPHTSEPGILRTTPV